MPKKKTGETGETEEVTEEVTEVETETEEEGEGEASETEEEELDLGAVVKEQVAAALAEAGVKPPKKKPAVPAAGQGAAPASEAGSGAGLSPEAIKAAVRDVLVEDEHRKAHEALGKPPEPKPPRRGLGALIWGRR